MPAKLELGPACDDRLQSISDALLGKTNPEPVVDKKTLVKALQNQNEIIRLLQMQVFNLNSQVAQFNETFEKNSSAMEAMGSKMAVMERSMEKVEEFETMMTAMDSKVGKLDGVLDAVAAVEKQAEVLAVKQAEAVTSMESFKGEITASVEDTKTGIKTLHTANVELQKTVVDMPGKIEVHSSQIFHDTPDGRSNLNLETFVNGFSSTLEEVQTQSVGMQAFVKDSSSKMESFDSDLMEELKGMTADFKGIMEWKEEQAGIDLVDIRRSQDAIKESVDTVQRDIFDKMPRAEVDAKLDTKFQEIIDHLQSALNSTKKDEDDFKSVTGNLNQVCEALKSDKADKTEIAALRKQFLQHQSAMMSDMAANLDNEVEGGQHGGGGGPESVDAGEIKEYLKHYLTTHQVHGELHKKADKTVEDIVRRMNGDVQNHQGLLQQIIERLNNSEQMLGSTVNQMNALRSSSPMPAINTGNQEGGGGGGNNAPGGEWKGLAGAMRMDATGSGKNEVLPALEQGSNFPELERTMMPREVFNNNNMEGVNNTDNTNNTNNTNTMNTTNNNGGYPDSGSGERYSPRTTLPPIGSQPALNLTSPLKQPNAMMQQGLMQQELMQQGKDAKGAMMMMTSKMRDNPIAQNLAEQPGAMMNPLLNPQGYPGGVNMVMNGMDGYGGGGGGGYNGGNGAPQLGMPSMDSRPTSQQMGSRPTTAQDLPVQNKANLTDFSPGMTYGGGFQIFRPDKPSHASLRGLDQSTNLRELAFEEQKLMIQGSDGRFYVGDKEVKEMESGKFGVVENSSGEGEEKKE
jgi:hypothetical protein